MGAVSGIGPARQALVWIGDHQGRHRGQGLLLNLKGKERVVLTCHHVVATVPPEDLRVALPLPDGHLDDRMPVVYDATHSIPEHDAAVLSLDIGSSAESRPNPLLHAVDPARYDGSLKATGLTYLAPSNFGATVGASTSLEYPGHDAAWPAAPARYAPPVLFRLEEPSDSRPGISGGVVLCEGGVLGLSSAGRGAGPQFEREAYLIPLSAWSAAWPALDDLIEPLLGTALRLAAKVRRASTLIDPHHGDVTIAGLRPDIYLEREADEIAREALATRGGVIIVGRPLSGKTRLALELLRPNDEIPDRLVVIPESPTAPPPVTLTTAGLAQDDMVLLVDDLHQTSSSAGPLEWRRLLTQTTGRTCQVICISRDGPDWKQAREWHPRLLAELGEALVFTSRVEGRGVNLSEADGRRLAERLELGLDDTGFDQRFEGTPGSLALDLKAMKARYEHLAESEVLGRLKSTLLDAAKLLHTGGQPRLLEPILRAVAEQIIVEEAVTRKEWERLRETAEEAAFGWWEPTETAGVLEFRTYRPYLERCVTYQPARSDFEGLLPILKNPADDYALRALGNAVRDRYPSLAELVYREAIAAGGADGWASLNLGGLLQTQPGREAEAETAYRDAIATGGAGGWASLNLGDLLRSQPGREAEAETAYRDAIAAGDPGGDRASLNLGDLLCAQPGRESEAELAYRQAIAAGDPDGLATLHVQHFNRLRRQGKD